MSLSSCLCGKPQIIYFWRSDSAFASPVYRNFFSRSKDKVSPQNKAFHTKDLLLLDNKLLNRLIMKFVYLKVVGGLVIIFGFDPSAINGPLRSQEVLTYKRVPLWRFTD